MDVWDDMAGEVAYALAHDLQSSLEYFDRDSVLMREDARADDPTRVDVRRRFLRVFDAERDFVRHVSRAVFPLLDGPPVVVLFDIDQTLGSRKSRSDEDATLVRPAAVPLMRALQEAGVTMGILTSRGITELQRNLVDGLHLQSLAPYVSETHLTAAEMDRHVDVATLPPSDEVTAELHERLAPLLQPEYQDRAALRALRDDRGRPLPPIDLAKLLQLAVVREDHPDTVFVVVDDRDYVDLLGGSSVRLVGVHLAPHERAHY